MRCPNNLKAFSSQLVVWQCYLGGLSAPNDPGSDQNRPISNTESLLFVGCCAHPHANFSQGQKKDLPRTNLYVGVSDEKTREPPSALNFTVIIVQNFCDTP